MTQAWRALFMVVPVCLAIACGESDGVTPNCSNVDLYDISGTVDGGKGADLAQVNKSIAEGCQTAPATSGAGGSATAGTGGTAGTAGTGGTAGATAGTGGTS